MTIIEEVNDIQQRILVQLIEINNKGSQQLKDKVSISMSKMEKDIDEIMSPQWFNKELVNEYRKNKK